MVISNNMFKEIHIEEEGLFQKERTSNVIISGNDRGSVTNEIKFHHFCFQQFSHFLSHYQHELELELDCSRYSHQIMEDLAWLL